MQTALKGYKKIPELEKYILKCPWHISVPGAFPLYITNEKSIYSLSFCL